MTSLQQLLQDFLSRPGASLGQLAYRTRTPYAAILALVHEGRVPAVAEQREALRRELGLDARTWEEVLAASTPQAAAMAGSSPLQRLLLEHLRSRGLDAGTLAAASGISHPAIVALIARGQIPRTLDLERLAACLGLDPALIGDALAQTRQVTAVPSPAAPQPPSSQE